MITAEVKSKVRFITLGCKVNQYETQGMREILGRHGVTPAEKEASAQDVNFVVINTCTVTADADKENRYWIRRARREHPSARIVVTGCWVERNRKDIEAIPEVDLILSNHEKARVADFLIEGCATETVQAQAGLSPRQQYTPLAISHTDGGGRAFVKIQDGCNHACSFCKVVMVRGRSRSRQLQDTVDEVKRLADSGYREIVFAGIQLGAYGLDFQKTGALIEMLEACAQIDGIERLRLSSIEPTDVRPELIRALRDIPECCHQLHIPLQSGDNEVLKNMNRRYTREFYRDLCAELKAAMPDFALTLDVMAGFAGETDEQFENTVRLLEDIRPLKCHVFPYSRREGTRAAQLADLPADVVRARVQRLMERGEALGREFRLPYVGQKVTVLAESIKKESGLVHGMTSNYLKVCFPGHENQIGRLAPVELLTLQGDLFLGAL